MTIKDLIPQTIKNRYHKMQSIWAHLRYDYPAYKLNIIGVTGTDGKTTTATMIYSILKKAGYKVGLITSVGARIDGKEYDTGFHVTTPDPWDIPRYLKIMVDAGVKWVVLEVTSHALDQNRVANIRFKKAVYTNITKEHLDYHKTWKNLALAKAKLINMVEEGGEVIYKVDEKGGKFVKSKVRYNKKVLIGTECNDNLVDNLTINRDGIKFSYKIKQKDVDLFIPILGEYNVANAQCAIKACENLVKRNSIIEALEEFMGVRGRMQVVRSKRPCLVIVDFAHTPNALKCALKTVKNLINENKKDREGRIILVFGSAGHRDKFKRKRMGSIARKLADVVVITSEDPREEKLSQINGNILKGANRLKGRLIERYRSRRDYRKDQIEKIIKKIDTYYDKGETSIWVFDEESVNSREDAIEFGIRVANSNDIVLVTGKGHENSLCFGSKEYDWNDVEAVKRAVKIRYQKS